MLFCGMVGTLWRMDQRRIITDYHNGPFYRSRLRCSSGGLVPIFVLLLLLCLASSLASGGTLAVDNTSPTGGEHWAFQPLLNARPPVVEGTRWPSGDVDRFIWDALEGSQIRPSEDADPHTWLRRVSFDLTGLPPSIEEIHDYVTDESYQARERVVDRLLASRAFGERWARHWLDLVGYADQIGTSNNVFAQHAWRYRDYIIDAFNADKPFNRFIREQIAGDLLPFDGVEERAAGLTATGFLVLGDIEIVEADKAKMLVDIVDQQLNKVGKAFLGMTLDCARCHDHKFDPISLHDYYAMAGFFHNTSSVFKTNRGVWSDVNVVDLPETVEQEAERLRRTAAHQRQLTDWKLEREEAQHRRNTLEYKLKSNGRSDTDIERWTKERDERSRRIGRLNQLIEHAEFFAPEVPKAHGVRDVQKPRDMRITIRGNPRALGDAVPRGFLKVASGSHPAIPDGQSGRLELANWISNHPLAARVAVNRIWQKLFGEGLVRSVDYFGIPGDRPSHPELLDYLSRQLVSRSWSTKKLIRSLVLSRTYGLDSRHNPLAHERDPGNRLYWRMHRVRLDAEALRDAMIQVIGELNSKSGGPSMPLEFPENVGGLNPKDVNPPSFRFSKWRQGQEYDRTIYLPVIRYAGQPELAKLRDIFDFPQPSQFVGKRSVTAVPTQALFLMNSPVVRQYATALSKRLALVSESVDEKLNHAWLTLLSRPISTVEMQESKDFLAESGDHAWVELCHALLAGNEFLMRL